MKRTILLKMIFSLLLCHAAMAQEMVVPGYMGLKVSIQYQLGVNPQWMNLSESYLPYLSHNLQMGYVVSRKHEVGIQYSRIDYSSDFFNSYGNYDSDGNVTNTISITHRNFTGNNLMAYIKFFRERKGFIAPLGRYYLLGLTYQNSKDRYLVSETSAPANYTTVQSHDIAATMGVGRNIILFDRMLLTVEGDLNFPLSTIVRAAKTSQFNTSQSVDGFFKQQNALDAMLVNVIQIKIGIGALIF
jgi:hypothetical protein